MNEGHKILLNSLTVFLILSFGLLTFGFFVYPNLEISKKKEVLPVSEVLSVVDQQNPYAFECEPTSPVVYVPVDFPTIQEAINSVNTETTIKVAPGIYNEQIVLKPNICLIGEEFGKVELQGFSDTVIQASSNSQVKNFVITSLGKSEVGVLISNSEHVNIEVNSFSNFETAILVQGLSKVSINANVFRDISSAAVVENSMFFMNQNNIEVEKVGLSFTSSEGEVIGHVIAGGENGIKANQSVIFFNTNIFKNQSLAGMQLCIEGEYEIGNNFFENTNEEIVY